jgi:hypothetical protein
MMTKEQIEEYIKQNEVFNKRCFEVTEILSKYDDDFKKVFFFEINELNEVFCFGYHTVITEDMTEKEKNERFQAWFPVDFLWMDTDEIEKYIQKYRKA